MRFLRLLKVAEADPALLGSGELHVADLLRGHEDAAALLVVMENKPPSFSAVCRERSTSSAEDGVSTTISLEMD